MAGLASASWSFCFGFASMAVLKWFGMLKVSKETELGGIDLFKHNVSAYPEFQAVRLCIITNSLFA